MLPPMAQDRPWLPSEGASRVRPRGVVVCLLLGLATLLGINAGAGWLLRKAGDNLGYRLMDQKWALANRGLDGAAIVVVGDSSGNQGLDPAAMSAALPGGPRVMNLCTVANGLTVHDAWILRRWIQTSGPPRGVVVVHTFDMWHRQADAADSAAIFARVGVPLWEWLAMRPRLDVSAGTWGRLLSARWAPLYASDQSLRELVARPEDTWARVTTGRGLGWMTVNDQGFMETNRANPRRVESDYRGQMGFLRNRREFRISDDNRRGLEELAALGQEHGFPVWIAVAPVYRRLGEEDRFGWYHAQIRAWLEAFAADHPHVHLVMPEPFLLEAEELQLVDHAIAAAAARYGRAVGEAIAGIWDEGAMDGADRASDR